MGIRPLQLLELPTTWLHKSYMDKAILSLQISGQWASSSMRWSADNSPLETRPKIPMKFFEKSNKVTS